MNVATALVSVEPACRLYLDGSDPPFGDGAWRTRARVPVRVERSVELELGDASCRLQVRGQRWRRGDLSQRCALRGECPHAGLCEEVDAIDRVPELRLEGVLDVRRRIAPVEKGLHSRGFVCVR